MPVLSRFWQFVPANAANNQGAELILYGDISSHSWWGDEITPKEFNKELAALGDVSDITVRINSGGGDVFAATAIFTRLKSHAAKITVIIDGWAASAASIIAMAGDIVKIPAAGCMMIHDPSLTLWGNFNAEDFARFENELNVVKNCIVNAYAMKTNKPKDEIAALMAAETWYTGEDAVQAGFCDEVLFADSAATAIVADVSRYKNPPETLFASKTQVPDKKPAALCGGAEIDNLLEKLLASSNENKIIEGDGQMEIKTVEELAAKYPALVGQIRDEAAQAERTRIQEIESIVPDGYKDLENKAKFESPVDAKTLAMQILEEGKKQGGLYLQNREKDIADSGVGNITTVSHEGGKDEPKNAFDDAIDRLLPEENEGR